MEEIDLIEDECKRFAEDMGRYCDSVLVLCTYRDKVGKRTYSLKVSEGNIYANVGICREYLDSIEINEIDDGEYPV